MGNTFSDSTPVVTPSDPRVSFGDYASLVGAPAIPEEEWARYCSEAVQVVSEVTYGRSDLIQDADDTARIRIAICRCADALHRAETFVASEKIGGYQVNNFASLAPTRQDAYAAVRRVLAGTGLTYSGISEPVTYIVGGAQ